MMRWLRRTAVATVALVVVVASVGVVYERWSRTQVIRDFPPPGELIEHGGQLSHLACSGTGEPTVILEGGLGVGGSLEWARVQPEIAAVTRVCSYDRAGILWSEPRAEPRHAESIAGELHELLRASAEGPPYVMVGHSLGGLFVRVYSQRFPDDVVGVVLVDSSHPEQFERSPPEVLAVRDETLSSPRPWLFRLWATTGGYRFRLPPPQNPISAFLPRTVPWGFLGELSARETTSEQAANTGTLGDRPLLVLTAGVGPTMPGVPEEILKRYYEIWLELQAELATLSSNSVHRIAHEAGHNIHVEDPGAVLGAVRSVVDAVRHGHPLSSEELTDG